MTKFPLLLCGLALLAVLGLSLLRTSAATAQSAPAPVTAQPMAVPAKPPAASGGEAAPRPASAFRRPAEGERGMAAAGSQGSLWTRWQTWIVDQQRTLSNQMTAAVRQLKTGDPLQALLSLAFISFIYGIVHAVGPGHGKAVITSYVFANERTLKRGIWLAIGSSVMQAITAVTAISILAILLNASGLRIQAYARHLETVSFALVAAIGAWLVLAQLRKLFFASSGSAAFVGKPLDDAHHHAHGPEHAGHHHHDHGHQHAPGETCGCGHNHIPAAASIAGDDWSWKKAVSIILAVGLRPCTGALIVLVFAYVNGLYWAGIASTFAMAAGTAITISLLAVLAVGSKQLALRLYGEESRASRLIVHGVAIAGGLVVFVLGVTLFLDSLGPARPFG